MLSPGSFHGMRVNNEPRGDAHGAPTSSTIVRTEHICRAFLQFVENRANTSAIFSSIDDVELIISTWCGSIRRASLATTSLRVLFETTLRSSRCSSKLLPRVGSRLDPPSSLGVRLKTNQDASPENRADALPPFAHLWRFPTPLPRKKAVIPATTLRLQQSQHARFARATSGTR